MTIIITIPRPVLPRGLAETARFLLPIVKHVGLALLASFEGGILLQLALEILMKAAGLAFQS